MTSFPSRRLRWIISVTLLILMLALPQAGAAITSGISRVSIASSGAESNGWSYDAAISASGQFVAFRSGADNLTPDDHNAAYDIFLHDRFSGTTELISLAANGLQANDAAYSPAISWDGRYVAFSSYASNLVSGDTNNRSDIFLRDRQEGITLRISVSSNHLQGSDGSYHPSISADGRFIVYASHAVNLVSGDYNGESDIFLYDRMTQQTTLISVSESGVQGNGGSFYPVISADGTMVAFESDASNLVTGDTNGCRDVFLHQIDSGATIRVSVDSNGLQGNQESTHAAISADGSRVAFDSDASNLVTDDTNGKSDVFLWEASGGTTRRVSVNGAGDQANGWSYHPALSANGSVIAFESDASNLAAGDSNHATDIFLYHLADGSVSLISVAANNDPAFGWSTGAALSINGAVIAFESDAANLVPNDTNGDQDIFVVDQSYRVYLPRVQR